MNLKYYKSVQYIRTVVYCIVRQSSKDSKFSGTLSGNFPILIVHKPQRGQESSNCASLKG